jgi:hypothetical protein
MKDVLNAMIDNETEGRMWLTTADVEAVKQEMDTAMEANPLSTDPKHAMGSQDESRQEK